MSTSSLNASDASSMLFTDSPASVLALRSPVVADTYAPNAYTVIKQR